jgi:hypothetical protein
MKRQNRAKDSFLKDIEKTFFVGEKEKFKNNICFSFEYFDKTQDAGQDFSQWTNGQLLKLIEKIKTYCGNSILHWTRERIGQGRNHVLEIYGGFPNNSDFFHPTFIPKDVEWARFRLEGDMRLIGFVLNHRLCSQLEISRNIFYIVFLDNSHRFFKSSF